MAVLAALAWALAGLFPSLSLAYDAANGLMMAHVEKAIYCGKERFKRWDVGDSIVRGPGVDTSRLRFIESDTTQAAAGVGVMKEPSGCFVAFRGTDGDVSSLLDAMFWLSDFNQPACPSCEVDFGFKKSYESIKAGVFDALEDFQCRSKTSLFLVGHSMGAAAMTYHLWELLHAGYKVHRAYALESPRPGNAAFAQALQRKAAGSSFWRVAHFKDIVVHVPPNMLYYEHALPEVYFPHRRGKSYLECGMHNATCSDHWHLWQLSTDDHMWYADLNPCSCSNETRTPPTGRLGLRLLYS